VARLVVESGGERREYPVAGSAVIGRLRSNSVFIDDHKLSREHARVQFDGRVFILQDLGSKNGTLHNGQKILQPATLRDNDTIRVGDIVFRFHLDPGDPQPPAPTLAPEHSHRAAEEAERANVAARISDAQQQKRKLEGPAGPDAGAAMMYYLILAGVLAGGTIVFKVVFGWALKVLNP
jgi:pSer/pThr/pTyr-binding forkhead associated (FHA) protein